MPKMHWDPETKLPVIFGDEETPPAHFLPHHPDDFEKLKPVDAEPDKVKALTRAEVTAALASGGIEFEKGAKLPDLTELLVESLKKALANANRPFSDDDAPRTLLDKVTGKE